MSKALELAENLQCWDLGPIRRNAVSVKKLMENASDELTRLAGVEAELVALREQKPAPWQPLKTSQKGRDAVATFFFDQLNRHDFTRYINSTLAADFACVLGGYLSSNPIATQSKPEQTNFGVLDQAFGFVCKHHIPSDFPRPLQPSVLAAILLEALWPALSDEGRKSHRAVVDAMVADKSKPTPQSETKLDKPARVRGVVFNTGVNIMTVIHAAQRCFEEYVPEDAAGIKEEILRGLPKTDDRKMLEYLMQQFNFEEWNCDRCGWSESTSKFDSADLLRRYLAGDKASMHRLSKDLQDDLLAIDNFPQPSGNAEQFPDRPEDHREHPQRGLAQS
jgi:hypothetical protein